MPQNITTSVGAGNANAEISIQVKTDYESDMWMRAVANFPYARFGKSATINRGKGGQKEWRRLTALSAATTPLDEQGTPDSAALTWEAVQAKPLEYGNWVEYSFLLEFQAIDPLIMETSQLLGENCGDTVDQITRDEIVSSGITIQYQNGLANLGAITSTKYMDYETIQRAKGHVTGKNARRVMMVDGFVLITHPHVSSDLSLDATIQKLWDNEARLGKGNPYAEGFVGRVANTVVFETTNAPITLQSAAPDIYDSVYIARDLYGVVGLAEHEFSMPEPGEPGDNTGAEFDSPVELIHREKGWNDFFGRFGGLGWYGTHDTLVLDTNNGVRIRTAARLGSAT